MQKPNLKRRIMSIEAMKQALDALNTTDTHPLSSAEQYLKEIEAMEALEDAIEDAEEVTIDWEAVAADQALTISMMRQREWVGLTDEEILNLYTGITKGTWDCLMYARAIETKLKERNYE
jgi:hypothetical protein